MASRRLSIAAGVAGVSAGLAPYLPTVVCAGGACTSCFACIGAGGAAASALLVGVISRKMKKNRPADGDRADEVGQGGVVSSQ